jgi:hypothetical protein
MVKKLTQHIDCMFRWRQHLDIAGNRKVTVAPRLETSGERSNTSESPSSESEGNANTDALAGVGAIKDDLAVQ